MTKAAPFPKRDVHAEITEQIIGLIESGKLGQSIDWARENSIPANFKTKQAYNGMNILLLWVAAHEAGYTSPFWLTYKQAQELGGNVRKGESGVRCIFYSQFERDNVETGETEKFPVVKTFTVFNLEQIEGIEKPQASDSRLSGEQQIDMAEAVLAASGARIIEEGDKAFYRPSTDEIYTPERQRFSNIKSFYSVTLHELTHWTGHKSRMARDFSGRFGSESYAFEELVAELGSAFLNAELGFVAETLPGHASYIESWLRVLRKDKKAIFTAASQASKAARFIMDAYEATTYSKAA